MLPHDFWQQYKYQIIGALLGILLHSLIFGLMITAERTEMGFVVVGLMDFPLMYLQDFLSLSEKYNTFFYGVGGTLLYGLLGWWMPPFLKWLFTRDPPSFFCF